MKRAYDPAFGKPENINRRRGLFISLEGIDGSGKSTQARLLQKSLGDGAILLREPSGGRIGESIRAQAKAGRARPLLEHRMFVQDREWDCKYNIRPALNSGKTVIMDRYVLSNLAYQGALGIPLDAIVEDNVGFPWPDLIVLIKVEVPLALKRIRKNRGEAELFEKEEYLNKVNHLLNSISIPNMVELDGSEDEGTIAKKILGLVLKLGKK
jgi:dTMP kinase